MVNLISIDTEDTQFIVQSNNECIGFIKDKRFAPKTRSYIFTPEILEQIALLIRGLNVES